MKKNKINYNNYLQKKNFNTSLNKKLKKKYKFIFKDLMQNLASTQNIFYFLNENFKFNFKLKDLKKYKKFKTIVVIGMGGSILGAEAIREFLKHKVKKNFIFLNDIDQLKIEKINKDFKKEKLLFLIISKSGNTTETLANLFALKILKKEAKNIIVICEKGKNTLYQLSKKMSLKFIEHKKFIGGRFSVLSEVGMLPAYLMETNFNNFKKNLDKAYLKKISGLLKDSSIKIAYMLLKRKYKNIVFLNYLPELNKFLFWAQQLIAESLGKKGKGFLPVVSNAPKDHHSLLQLYLDGPKDNIFYIFSLEKKVKLKLRVKNLDKLKFLNNKSLQQIKEAQKNAFIKTLKEKDIPFREFKINELSEETLGELFSYFILETILVGKLTNINPFDQPAVEQVKVKTKKLLN